MEHFDNVDKVAFKDLTPEQMACIVKANIEGNVEYYYYTKWYKTEHNDIYLNRIYRTIPKPAKKLDIPWNILHTQWKYATFDYEGIYLWAEEPNFIENRWVSNTFDCHYISGLFDIDIEGVEYETSLTERPE